MLTHVRVGTIMTIQRKQFSLRALVTVSLGMLLLAAGVAHAEGVTLPLPAEDQQKINTQLGANLVIKALPSKPIDDVSTYFPLQDRAQTYRVTARPHTGNSQTLGLAHVRLSG